jgi:DNA-binding CsgD family transcriptional regulator
MSGAGLGRIIEASYGGGDDASWLERLLRATQPVLDAGLGVVGFFYDMRDVDAPQVRPPIMLDTPPGACEALERLLALAPRAFLHALHRPVPSCTTMSERLGLGERVVDLPLHRSTLAPLGIADFLGVAATSASGTGCLVGAPLPRVSSMGSFDEHVLTQVAAHVAAGMRRRCEPPALRTSDGDDAALAALRAGEWIVVDAFDRGGARFVVAKQGAHKSGRALTAREEDIVARAAKGHANKRIAKELGLAPSTVAGHLARAATKLGVRTRVEMTRAFVRDVRNEEG